MASSVQSKRASAARSDSAAADGWVASIPAADVRRMRHILLDALPIAAAVLVLRDGALHVDDSNVLFDRIGVGATLAPDEAPRSASPADHAEFRSEALAFLSGQAPRRQRLWEDGDGVAARSFHLRFAMLPPLADAAPRCLVTLVDRTAEVQTAKSLQLGMLTCSLTGLPNRTGFLEMVDRALERTVKGVALLVVDLRRFGRINESVGALAGDELLITVARRLMTPLRAGDIVARLGANEFGILVGLKGQDDPVAVAGRIEQVFATPFRLSDLEIRVDCAIGCVAAEPGLDGEELIRRAQFTVKRAKSTNRTERYQPIAHDQARRRFSLETELRRAIEAERLQLAYQPVVSLDDGKVCGVEALARWTLDGRAIPPAEFVPVAEESGLIVPLGRWAIDHAVRTLARWDARAGRSLPVAVAVNLSPLQISIDDVPGAVRAALDHHRLPGSRLVIEITESAIIADPDRARATLAALKDQGIEIAMDDFGTGYSNLAFLRRLPIDVLKIDRSFVTGMAGQGDEAAIVGAILSLARALGLRTTAEGIETPDVAALLRVLGCTRGQGYHYAPPLPSAAAFAHIVARA